MQNANSKTLRFPDIGLSTTEIPNICKEIQSGFEYWTRLLGLTMANTPTISPWKLSPAVVTLVLLIASILTSSGYYIGRQAQQIETIQKQADDASKAAKDTKDIVLSGAAESSPTPTPKVKK